MKIDPELILPAAIAVNGVFIGIAMWLGGRRICKVCGKAIAEGQRVADYNWDEERWEYCHRSCKGTDC